MLNVFLYTATLRSELKRLTNAYHCVQIHFKILNEVIINSLKFRNIIVANPKFK